MSAGLASGDRGCRDEQHSEGPDWSLISQDLTNRKGAGLFNVFLTHGRAEIGFPMMSLGYSMACHRASPYAKLPYAQLGDVLRPEVLQQATAKP